MAKKKTSQLKSLIEDSKKQMGGYMINGEPVSEYKFFLSIRRELRGEKTKKQFYWTDEKVKLLLSCFRIEVTDKQLNDFKKQAL